MAKGERIARSPDAAASPEGRTSSMHGPGPSRLFSSFPAAQFLSNSPAMISLRISVVPAPISRSLEAR